MAEGKHRPFGANLVRGPTPAPRLSRPRERPLDPPCCPSCSGTTHGCSSAVCITWRSSSTIRWPRSADFQLGDRPIDEWSPDEVRAYCQTYNVGWVVCWSPLSRFWFDRYPQAVKVATLPRYSSPRPSAFDQPARMVGDGPPGRSRRGDPLHARRESGPTRSTGSSALIRTSSRGRDGSCRSSPTGVELADVEPTNGSVVVSLHWLDTWKTDPPLTLKPEPMPPDLVDFVRIEMPGPVRKLVLSNGYGR